MMTAAVVNISGVPHHQLINPYVSTRTFGSIRLCRFVRKILVTAGLVTILLAWSCAAASVRVRPVLVREYLTTITPEPPEIAEQRHQLVAARRKGQVIIVHRGAAAFAPENTLEAFAAAMDHGGDGCKVDIRQTVDGVLVVFNDETLDWTTEGFGPVEAVTFRQIENVRPHVANGRPRAGLVPTFAALLDLARERSMLLHLDLKVPGIEDKVAHLLEEANAWDHVVFLSETNATKLRQHPKLHLLTYKASGLHERGLDLDPLAVSRALNQPGEMILVRDPRIAALVLGRKLYSPQPFSKRYRLTTKPAHQQPPATHTGFSPMNLVRELEERFSAATPESLVTLLRSPRVLGANSTSLAPGTAQDQMPRLIVTRAWAAQQIGLRGLRTKEAVAALEEAARFPSCPADPCYSALDGAAAIRALAKLSIASSVPLMIRWCEDLHIPPAPSMAAPTSTEFTGHKRLALAALQALGDMKCMEAKHFLERYVNSDNTVPRLQCPELLREATVALMRQKVSWDEIAALVRHKNPIVRGTATLECVDHPGEERLLGLRVGAPWALSLVSRSR